MQQSHEDGARPRTGRAWEPLRLLCCALPRSANQISPMPGRTAGAGVSTVVAGSMVTDLADPMVADSTPDFAGFMVTDLTVAGSTAQGIAASRSGTMVSPTGTRASGPMAGAMEAAAGGAVPGWMAFLSEHIRLISIWRLLRLWAAFFFPDMVLLFQPGRILALRDPMLHRLAGGLRRLLPGSAAVLIKIAGLALSDDRTFSAATARRGRLLRRHSQSRWRLRLAWAAPAAQTITTGSARSR